MNCIDCGSKTKVVDSLLDDDVRFRRRKCLKCGKLFYTVEDLMPYTMDDRLRRANYRRCHGKEEYKWY